MTLYIAALLVGFLGSFHCVAMCGPIALALSSGQGSAYYIGRLMYNTGRIFTYSLLGLIAGLIGRSFFVAGFQQSFSVAIGVITIIAVLLFNFYPAKMPGYNITLRLNSYVKNIFSKFIRKKSYSAMFITGMANGVLPCGFVYLALTGALAAQHPIEGMIYMVFFGLGTVPAMMAVSLFGKMAGIKVRSVVSRFTPVIMILLGLFFIYRGLMISENGTGCHHSSMNISQVSDSN